MTLRQSRKPQILASRMVDSATRIHPAEYGNVSDYVKQRAPKTGKRHPLTSTSRRPTCQT